MVASEHISVGSSTVDASDSLASEVEWPPVEGEVKPFVVYVTS